MAKTETAIKHKAHKTTLDAMNRKGAEYTMKAATLLAFEILQGSVSNVPAGAEHLYASEVIHLRLLASRIQNMADGLADVAKACK